MTTVKLRVLFLLVAGLLLSPAAARAQYSPGNEAVRKLYTDFFEAFTQAGPAGAIGVLAQSGSISQQTAQALERRLQSIQPNVGRADSYAVVSEMEIPNSLRYRSATFLTHHENVPVAWRLRFYQKTNGVWVISDVDFELRYVEDFLRLPEIQFAAFRALVDRLPKEEGSRDRGQRWP